MGGMLRGIFRAGQAGLVGCRFSCVKQAHCRGPVLALHRGFCIRLQAEETCEGAGGALGSDWGCNGLVGILLAPDTSCGSWVHECDLLSFPGLDACWRSMD